jgi:hypothetical protein
MSGIYTLTCPDCNKAYIGQTERLFTVRFREHFHDFTHTYNKSKLAQHLLDRHHSIGPMDTLHITTKGRMMNTMEKFHIYIETLKNNQINDKCTVRPNVIFDTIAQHNPDRTFNPSLTPLPPLSYFLHATANGRTPHSFLTSKYRFHIILYARLYHTRYSYNTYTCYFYYRSCTQYTEDSAHLFLLNGATKPHTSRWEYVIAHSTTWEQPIP